MGVKRPRCSGPKQMLAVSGVDVLEEEWILDDVNEVCRSNDGGWGNPPTRALRKPSCFLLSVGNVALHCLCCLTPQSWRTWQVRKGVQWVYRRAGPVAWRRCYSLTTAPRKNFLCIFSHTFGSILRQVQVRANCNSQFRADGNYWNMIRTYKGRRDQYSGRKMLIFLNTPARQRDSICRPVTFP